MDACSRRAFAAAAVALAACGTPAPAGDGGDVAIDAVDARDATPAMDAAELVDHDATADAFDVVDAADAPAYSRIEHVVIFVMENHTFDAYFGRYCTAPAGSSPACNDGPACCERAPDTDPSGTAPTVLDDAENGSYDPNHTQACEQGEMNGGAMDRYARGTSCSDARNFAIAPDDVVRAYHQYAARYALADRYFQPIVGQSSSNDMYLAVAHEVFIDNQFKPSTLGHGCTLPASTARYTGQTTIADLLLDAGYRFAFYAEGYAAMRAATLCPSAPSDCPFGLPTTPCDYDPSDVPFEYYDQFADNTLYMKDLADFMQDLAHGSLPDVAFVKPVGYHNEHPGYGTRITDGEHLVDTMVQAILASSYAPSTLVLVTWDEGGGFFDHVTPPGESPVDHQALGTRVPLLAIGPFARRGFVSHVPMEHSSLVRFLEWNFLGDVGQLRARDALVNNIGSLLDPAATGLAVPEH